MVDLNVFKQAYIVQGVIERSGEPALAELAALGTELDFPAQKELIVAGEKRSDLYVILEGKVIVLTPNGDKLAEVGASGVLGEMALIDDQPRSAHAVALTTVKVVRLEAQALRQFFARKPEVGFVVVSNIAVVLAGRLRKADKTIDHLLNLDPWKHSS